MDGDYVVDASGVIFAAAASESHRVAIIAKPDAGNTDVVLEISSVDSTGDLSTTDVTVRILVFTQHAP